MGRVIWNSKIMEVEDLPTLADALRVADANLLADEVLRLCRPHKGTGKKKTAKARKRVLRTIDEMRSVESTRHEPADEMVLIPLLTCEYMAGRRGAGFELGMEAELIAVSEMWRAGAELCGLADEKGDGRPVWLMGYGYEWTPWEDVLGYRVWLGGFGGNGEKDVAAGSAAATPAPGDKALLPRLVRSSRCQVLSRRDRYRFLAAAVWNMTFCGWTKSGSRARLRSSWRGLTRHAKSQRTFSRLTTSFLAWIFSTPTRWVLRPRPTTTTPSTSAS